MQDYPNNFNQVTTYHLKMMHYNHLYRKLIQLDLVKAYPTIKHPHPQYYQEYLDTHYECDQDQESFLDRSFNLKPIIYCGCFNLETTTIGHNLIPFDLDLRFNH